MKYVIFCISFFLFGQIKLAYCQLNPIMVVELFDNQVFTIGEKEVHIVGKSEDHITLHSFDIETRSNYSRTIEGIVPQNEGELLDVSQYKNNFYFLFQKSIMCYDSLSKHIKKVSLSGLALSTKVKVFHKIFANQHGIYVANFFSSGPGDEKIKIIRLDSDFNVLSQYYKSVAYCDPFSIYFSEFGLVSVTPETGNLLVVTDETNPIVEVLDKGLNKTKDISLKELINKNLSPKTNLCLLYNEYLRKNTFKALDKLTAAVDTSAFIGKIIPVGESGFVVSACYFDSSIKFIDYQIQVNERWQVETDKCKPLGKNFNPSLPVGIDNLPFNTFYGAQRPVSNGNFIATKFISPKSLEFAKKQSETINNNHKSAQYHSYVLVLGTK